MDKKIRGLYITMEYNSGFKRKDILTHTTLTIFEDILPSEINQRDKYCKIPLFKSV
jgi:hypothetical protein